MRNKDLFYFLHKKMETCCNEIVDMKCAVRNILQRITPIQFKDGVLIVDSPLSAIDSISIGDVPIGGANGVLQLPQGTTVGGVQLLSPLYIDNIYTLPSKTIINNFPILNTNYFYFYTVNNRTTPPVFTTGCFINNNTSSNSVSSTSFVPNYPFVVPDDCILTSLLFSLVIDGSGASTITNATATLYTMSPTNIVTNTGISSTIPTSPINSRNFASVSFQYAVPASHRVGVRVSFTGTTTSVITSFATLGYKFPL